MSWFWLLIFAFASICVIADYLYKYKKAKLQAQTLGAHAADAVAQRLEKIEKRLSNLETIVLDAEKSREFERQL